MSAILKNALVDAGPLIAAAVKRDKYHRVATRWFRSHRTTLLFTTLPALAEACHALKPALQAALLRSIDAGTIRICPIEETDMAHAADLIERYHDRPMDFADATLVIAAEKLGITDIASVDHADFDIYRTAAGRSFHNHLPRISGR